MMVPLVAQKMLSEDIALWGVGSQYSVEFAPVIVCSVFAMAAKVKKTWLRRTVVIAMPLLCGLVTWYTCTNAKAWVQRENVRIFYKDHYRQEQFDTDYARKVLKQLPPEVSVCASSCFTPRLAMRDSVYLYPVGLHHNPEYVMLKSDDLPEDTAGLTLIETNGEVYLFHR
jgi:uncharacterized membrane protein